LLQGPAELVWAGGVLGTAAHAVKPLDDVVNLLSAHQLTDALQIAVAASEEENLLDDVVLVSSHVDQFRAGAVGFVLYMFCLHKAMNFLLSAAKIAKK